MIHCLYSNDENIQCINIPNNLITSNNVYLLIQENDLIIFNESLLFNDSQIINANIDALYQNNNNNSINNVCWTEIINLCDKRSKFEFSNNSFPQIISLFPNTIYLNNNFKDLINITIFGNGFENDLNIKPICIFNSTNGTTLNIINSSYGQCLFFINAVGQITITLKYNDFITKSLTLKFYHLH